jgi:hypothetical protein
VIVDGMNEHGLAASSLKVPCRPGSGDSDKTAIVSNHVMRLALDYARDVDEALQLLGDYDVAFPAVCVHFFLADASGRSVIIEYIDGEPVVIDNVEPWQVVTNFLVSEEQPQGNSSPCWRYNVAYQQLQQTGGTVTAPQAMSIAAAASVPDTIWSAIYNLSDGGIDVVVGGNYDRVHHFELTEGR